MTDDIDDQVISVFFLEMRTMEAKVQPEKFVSSIKIILFCSGYPQAILFR